MAVEVFIVPLLEGCGAPYIEGEFWYRLGKGSKAWAKRPFKPPNGVNRPLFCGSPCNKRCCLQLLCASCGVKGGLKW